ncbi:zinc transporter ZitB [compost metagenome]
MSDCGKTCTGSATPPGDGKPAEAAGRATRRSHFAVPQMDCAAEERLVRLALEPMPQVLALVFDLPGRQLQVLHNGDIAPVARTLEKLGLGARLTGTEQAAGPAQATTDTRQQARVLRWLLAINALMFLVELGCGLLAQSTGLIADSLDMFADAAVYGVALYAVGRAVALQVRAARLAGVVQLLLALTALGEVARRFLFGSEPESLPMIGVGLLALLANVTCLYLIAGQRDGGVHMRASWIFSANDVLANLGVIGAGALVAWTGSPYPDLLIGSAVGLIVLNGARRILALKA